MLGNALQVFILLIDNLYEVINRAAKVIVLSQRLILQGGIFALCHSYLRLRGL